jgi:2-succinyl-5-enolpyruvyl-6-hydroxy-3-cyclohexene-1-carboxylate synthase
VTTPPAVTCAAVLLAELGRLGVTDVVVCPGSRSAPLAVAAAAGSARLWVRVDERSAGFFALGLAKATGRATAVITTSGTAVANLGPALLEARHAHVPLIALTADRPATLVGTGANQTADQVHLFPGVAKAVIRVSSADAAPAAWGHAARRAVTTAEGRLDRTPGPVHVNVEIADPAAAWPPAGQDPTQDPAAGPPFTDLPAAPAAPAAAAPLDGRARTVIVAGDLPVAEGRAWAARAAAAHLPLLAEPSSNARRGPAAIRHYRDLLAQFDADIDRVVLVGHPTLSRPVTALLSGSGREIVCVSPTADWPDPGWAVSRVVADLVLTPGNPAWLEAWLDADHAVASAPVPLEGPLTGPALAAAVLAALGPDDRLVLGSSLVIRDADRAPVHPDPPAVYANRGLAGIDGTIATALGIAAALGPATALIGDLSALHDLTSLVIPSRERDLDLRLVIADDNGGAIFRTLEAAAGPPDAFERLFTVPHGLDLAAAATALGATAVRVTTPAGLGAALAAPWRGRHVIVASIV